MKEFFPDTEDMKVKRDRLTRLINERMKLVSDEVILRVFDKFGPAVFRRCSAPADYAEKVFRDVFAQEPVASHLEIGCLNGITAAVMTQYADVVHTIDIVDYPLKYEIWDFLGLSGKIKFHLIKNEVEKFDLIENLDFQSAYPDGNHVNHTFSDFLITRKCGRLLFHEAGNESSQPWNLVKSLPKDEIKSFSYKKGKKTVTSNIVYWKRNTL